MSVEVYELVLNGPGKNALGSDLMRAIVDEVRAADGRPILVTGTGDAFSAGLNLKDVAALDRPGMERFLLLLDEVIETLYGYPAPTVAAVNGHAIAGGCVIALCCDLRIAVNDPRARIGLNEVARGLEFPPKILALARQRIPAHALQRVLLEGGLHDPAAALGLGLLDEIAGDPVARARECLAVLAAHPPAIYAATKRVVRDGTLDLTDDQRRYFREHLVPVWCSPETKERVRAALERR
jgi:enoyl-CoA hydratase/carnithine racemase